MKTKLSGSRILITGGTGSFGNRVARYLLNQNPAEIIIFSRDEKKQYDMQKDFPQFKYIIGNVRDFEAVKDACMGVDYIFHAAALKQVPTCETYPYEAVKTNVLGSQNLCRAARESGVKVMVALSTDKAVKPVNAMGISKSMMEKIVTSQNQYGGETKFCCVRYGNVMGSRGSVIPLFKKLIDKGETLTITDDRMTRFLMTLDESVDLVLHAMTNVEGGEVFVRKAPAVKIRRLAEVMLEKYGDGDLSKIKEIGVRPGEKIDEVLVNEYEIRRAEESDQFFKIYPEYRDVEVKCTYESGYEYTSANTTMLKDAADIGQMLDNMGKTEFYH